MTDDINLYYFAEDYDGPLSNTEVLICDDCNVVWNQMKENDEDISLSLTVVSADLERRFFAQSRISPEGAAHKCKGHRHAACQHVYERFLESVNA